MILIAGLLVLSGCATPPAPDKTIHISELETHFGSGIGVVADYVTDGKHTIITFELDNPAGRDLKVWISHTYKTDGAESIRRRRVMDTSDLYSKITIRADALEDGIEEIVFFEVFNPKGETLLKTKPLVYDNVTIEKQYIEQDTIHDGEDR